MHLGVTNDGLVKILGTSAEKEVEINFDLARFMILSSEYPKQSHFILRPRKSG
jgi:hypothetical protein